MRVILVIGVILGFARVALAADAPKWAVEVKSTRPPTELAEPVRAVLDEAWDVTRDGESVAIIWLRRELPTDATDSQLKNGLTSEEVSAGTLVGAVRFDRDWTDYRKQRVAAGVYTLRFAKQPPLGDHNGTSPHPEFLLLSPADADLTADDLEPKTLIGQSARTVGGKHPSVMLLVPNHKPADKPTLVEKSGLVVVNGRRTVRAKGGTGVIGLGLTVFGQTSAEIDP